MGLRRMFGREQGQSLVVVTVMLVALIGFMGLIFDAGNFWTQRRFVQNGADAGALAGARELGIKADAASAVRVASEYATIKNGLGDPANPADQVTVEVGIDASNVAVTVTKVFRTYFLGALGIPSFTMRAQADAGFTPAGGMSGLLPLAVKESVIDEILARDGSMMVTIYDDDKEATDMAIHKIANGERGWVNFDGGPVGSDELRDWIGMGGYPGTITVPGWINGTPGSNNSALGECYMWKGQKIYVPLYDAVRDPKDRSAEESGLGSGPMDYHFVSFAVIIVDDIKDTGNPKWLKGTLTKDVIVGKPGGEYDTGVYVVGLRR